MKDILDLIARICISVIFFFEAYDSIQAFKHTKEIMTNYGITWQQDFLLTGSIILLVVGGILILIGYRTSLGVILLLAYLIPVTLIAHAWWNVPEEMRRIESIIFMKNLAIIGGLLMLFVNGSGRYSVRRLFATTKVN